MYFVGIDVAKDHHDVTVLDDAGKVVLTGFRFVDRMGHLPTRKLALLPCTRSWPLSPRGN